jgi:putative ABC transport system substrate-binding protein
MSYCADYAALMRRTAWYVDKVLKGAKPSDLPIEEPSAFNFAINLGTASMLGIAMPPSLTLRATTVVQ